MRASSRRLPTREIAFLALLVAAAAGLSWASGRAVIVQEAFAPFLSATSAVTGSWNGAVERVNRIQTLESENAGLKAKVAALDAELRAREEQAAENARLHRLLKLPVPDAAKPVTVARVVGRAPGNWHQRLVLDKGAEAGVTSNAIVANQTGMIGKVLASSPHTALTLALTDPGFAVSVMNTRTRATGMLQGQGDPWPVLRLLEHPDKWKVGDRLITSGMGGVFPKGLRVGQVVQLKEAGGVLLPELRVQPAVELSAVEEAIVLPAGLTAMPTPTPKPTPTPSPAPSATPRPGARR